MTPHARRIQPAARPEAREPVARRITPDSRPTDIRRLVAALLSAVIPGLGQAVNGRFRLARWLLIPALVLVPLVIIAIQLFSPVRLAAWAINPAVLQTLLVLNVIVLVWRLIAVAQAFFDGRYPAVPGRLGFAGLVVVTLLVMAPARVCVAGGYGGGQGVRPRVPGRHARRRRGGHRAGARIRGADQHPARRRRCDARSLRDAHRHDDGHLARPGRQDGVDGVDPARHGVRPARQRRRLRPEDQLAPGFRGTQSRDVPERPDARAAGRDRRAARDPDPLLRADRLRGLHQHGRRGRRRRHPGEEGHGRPVVRRLRNRRVAAGRSRRAATGSTA